MDYLYMEEIELFKQSFWSFFNLLDAKGLIKFSEESEVWQANEVARKEAEQVEAKRIADLNLPRGGDCSNEFSRCGSEKDCCGFAYKTGAFNQTQKSICHDKTATFVLVEGEFFDDNFQFYCKDIGAMRSHLLYGSKTAFSLLCLYILI